MRRIVGRCSLVALLAMFSPGAEAAPILVSADATVAAGAFANTNFGDDSVRGGLLSGQEGSGIFGPYRFYLMFTLPVLTPGSFISSATLQGFYYDDWDTFDDRTHSIYLAPSSWTESAITWNNQPGSTGGPIGTFNAAQASPGGLQSWNVTSTVNSAYLGQSPLLSFLFRADNEALGSIPIVNNNLEYFAARELLNGTRAFRLDVELGGVPEPATMLLFGAGLAGAVRLRWRRGGNR